MSRPKKDKEIEDFLYGHNPLKYLTSVEANKYTNVAVCYFDDPEEKRKYVKSIKYKPFLFYKPLKLSFKEGESQKLKKEHGIEIKKLRTGSSSRLMDGYTYLIETNRSFNTIVSFFKKDSNSLKKILCNIKKTNRHNHQKNNTYIKSEINYSI